MLTRLLARSVRGIEPVVADEIRERGLGRVRHVRDREVWFDCAKPTSAALELRTADDVLLVAAVVNGIGHHREALGTLASAARGVPVLRLLALRERFGGPSRFGGVDVSASFLGRRNYNRYDLEDAVGPPLAAAVGATYHSRRRGRTPPPGGLCWRVTVGGDRAVLSLRIGSRPLHRREYRTTTRRGSLHPPVAAALVRIAAPAGGTRLIDPCCGTGTIPIEAATSHPALSCTGTDHSAEAAAAATANGAGHGVRWLVADAGRLPFGTGSFDAVVSNPPWDRQVRPAGELACRPHRFWNELVRVLRPGGRVVLLLPETGAELPAALVPDSTRPISLNGRHPVITVLRRP